MYSGSGQAGASYTIQSAAGEHVMTFVLPRSYSQQFTLLFSSPGLTASTGYTLYQGGSVTGGTVFHGLTTDGDYTPGTSKKTFTLTGTVTSIR